MRQWSSLNKPVRGGEGKDHGIGSKYLYWPNLSPSRAEFIPSDINPPRRKGSVKDRRFSPVVHEIDRYLAAYIAAGLSCLSMVIVFAYLSGMNLPSPTAGGAGWTGLRKKGSRVAHDLWVAEDALPFVSREAGSVLCRCVFTRAELIPTLNCSATRTTRHLPVRVRT